MFVFVDGVMCDDDTMTYRMQQLKVDFIVFFSLIFSFFKDDFIYFYKNTQI